jgi:hypothetical protein
VEHEEALRSFKGAAVFLNQRIQAEAPGQLSGIHDRVETLLAEIVENYLVACLGEEAPGAGSQGVVEGGGTGAAEQFENYHQK